MRREVIGGSLLHFLISSVLVLPAIMLILDGDWREAMLLAIALSFSSTVLAAKVLESKRELRAFHGRVAIGVLIIRDLIALVVMSLAAGRCRPHGRCWCFSCRCCGRCCSACSITAATRS